MLKNSLGLVLAAIRFIIIILGMILWMLAYFITTPILGNNQDRAFWLRKHYLKYLAIPVLNLRIELVGAPPTEGNFLYISNHRSFADPVVLCRYIDAFVIAKAEVAKYPIINRGAELTGVLYVKRTDKSSRSETRKLMIETIQSGRNILVYPEGTVSTTKRTLPFNPGTFHSAAEHGFNIVPVAIEYRDNSDLWTYHSFVRQVFNQFSKWAIYVKLEFGQPIHTNNGETLVKDVEAWVNDTLLKMQKNWSRAKYTG
jgi:1-acyl-sn-glycerol-3-phosphate acyltransferase